MTVTSITNKIGKADINHFDGKSSTFTRLTSAGGVLTCYKVGSTIDVLATYGENANANSNTINEALKGISSDNYAIEFPPGNWTISENVTIPDNLQVIISRGCVFQVANGITVTMPVPVASRCKWIELTGTGLVTFSGPGEVMPEWWGNNTTPGTTDMTAEIEAAANAIGSIESTLSFSDEYYISDDLTISGYCYCRFPYGAKLKIADTKLVTINGPISAGAYQIFNDLNPTLDGVATTATVGYWQWWGSDATAFAAAIAAGIDPVEQISRRGQASGYASLNASSKVIENPANAVEVAAVGKIPVANSSGLLDSSWFRAMALAGAFSRLRVQPNAITPATKIDIDADCVTVTDGTNYYVSPGVNLTIDYGANGANGLDTGSLSAGWYYNYVIYNPTTDTTAGLGSTSATSPSMPAGYTYKKLVSSTYYGGSEFTPFLQFNAEVFYITQILAHTVDNAAYLGSASWDINLNALVPTNALKMTGQIKTTTSYGAEIVFAWDASGTYAKHYILYPIGMAVDTFVASVDFNYLLNPYFPQTVYVKNGLDANNRGQINIDGFVLDI